MFTGGRHPDFFLFRAAARFWAWGVLVVVCLSGGVVWAGQPPRAVETYRLGNHLKAAVVSDGSLRVGATTLLRGYLDPLSDSRRKHGALPATVSFAALSSEGHPGGQRGFSAQADDDGDGQVAEDPLDGLDNDGDGLVDEDYSAISDAMTVVHLSQGQGQAQLEFMQWAGPRLGGALFLNLSARHDLSGSVTPYYRLALAENNWQEVEAFAAHHDQAGQWVSGQGTAFVAQLPNPQPDQDFSEPSTLEQGVPVWLGVMVLDSMEQPGRRPVLDGSLLSLPLGDSGSPVVVATAGSWIQLNRLLMDAAQVYQGVTDPVTGYRTPWIVRPPCSRCRLDDVVDLSVVREPDRGLRLEVLLQPGKAFLLDPDRFELDGQVLGSPRTITWEPLEGLPQSVSWQKTTSASLIDRPDQARDYFQLLETIHGHQATGKLEFLFAEPAAGWAWLPEGDAKLGLTGLRLDGRPLATMVPVQGEKPRTAPEISGNSSSQEPLPHQGRLALSPKLLEGWPNPFRDQITIEFKVPRTIEETFDWTLAEDLPSGLDKSGPMVWPTGQPAVSVKVYSLNGQELVSLQNGSLGPGNYTARWNGTDSFGRQVASGTYFCKLQIDDWSVTRRLVFIR